MGNDHLRDEVHASHREVQGNQIDLAFHLASLDVGVDVLLRVDVTTCKDFLDPSRAASMDNRVDQMA